MAEKRRYIEIYSEKTMLEYEENVNKKMNFTKNKSLKGLSVSALDEMM
jgi:hypothetical protein